MTEKLLQFRNKWGWAITPVLIVIYFLAQYWYDSEHKKPIAEVKTEIKTNRDNFKEFKSEEFKPLRKKVDEVLTHENYYKLVDIAEELDLSEWRLLVNNINRHSMVHEAEEEKIDELQDRIKDLETEIKILKIKIKNINEQ